MFATVSFHLIRRPSLSSSHHTVATLVSSLRFASRHRSIIILVAIYCANVRLSSSGRRRKSPPPASPTPPLHPPARSKPILFPAPYAVAAPSSCGPPCGGICPTPSSCTASGPMYLTRKSWPIALLPSNYGPRSGHLLFPYSKSEPSTSTFVYCAICCGPPPSSCLPLMRELTQGNWSSWPCNVHFSYNYWVRDNH